MLPKKVLVCGIPYSVEIHEDQFNTDCNHFGAIEYKPCKIYISDNMPEAMQLQTLIHEWVHGALFSIGYDELRSDEKFVQNLALAINEAFCFKPERKEADDR